MKTYQSLSLVCATLTGLIIFCLSSLPNLPNPMPTISLLPVIYHFLVFSAFSFFICLTLSEYYLFAGVFSLVYAGLDELHQYFVPNRVCSFFDFGIDASGIVIGIILAFTIILTLKKNNL